jgi:hypothetical protein
MLKTLVDVDEVYIAPYDAFHKPGNSFLLLPHGS